MQNWFHAIGACGKTTANVAVMFKKMGWFVTGTDTQYLPPASHIIENNGIHFELGYSFKHLTKEFWEEKLGKTLDIPQYPTLGLIVESATSKNKELLFAKKNNIDIRPYAQVLRDYLVKENSVVVIGTAGKTTTTALMTYILDNLGLEPSYMIGADTLDFDESLKNTESNWSVIEGDEYFSHELSTGAKFMQYKPKYLMITKISWEHVDVYPTEAEYVEEFKRACDIIPSNGLIVAKYGDKNIDIVLQDAKCKIIRYTLSDKPLDHIWTVIKSENAKHQIFDGGKNLIMEFDTKLIGDYNLENILASVALLLNIPAESMPEELISNGTKSLQLVADTIGRFKGARKRLEILYKSENLILMDDFGVAPERARNSIHTIKEYYSNFKLAAVFDPNTGSRPVDAEIFNKLYSESFQGVDRLIIPDLTENMQLIQTNQMVENLKQLGFNAEHIPTENLLETLEEYKNTDEPTLIVFFSAFRLDSISQELAKYLQT